MWAVSMPSYLHVQPPCRKNTRTKSFSSDLILVRIATSISRMPPIKETKLPCLRGSHVGLPTGQKRIFPSVSDGGTYPDNRLPFSCVLMLSGQRTTKFTAGRGRTSASHAAYGDYDESCLFGYAAGMVMASLYDTIIEQRTKNKEQKPNVVMHANEWQTAFAIFYIRYHRPAIGTLFTTHATGIGRSIAGNGKPLYDYFEGYNGDQMAEELNMVSKHSVEKMAAKWADCFTTVSDLTARECAQLLDKPVDIVTPNGFEPGFVPTGKMFDKKRTAARQALLHAASERLGGIVPENALMLCIAGRQEWKNKGIDVFLRAMQRLGEKMYQVVPAGREVIAFVMIPYLDRPVARIGKVSVVFVPYYLDGHDPMFGGQANAEGGKSLTYYDLLIGMDATVFPSYYEPWGYTPLESVAFHVPTITTTLAGFGVWAKQVIMRNTQHTTHNGLEQGVEVINRTDSNYYEVVEQIADSLIHFLQLPPEQVAEARKAAAAIAHKAEWRFFFKYYRQAYAIALKKAAKR